MTTTPAVHRPRPAPPARGRRPARPRPPQARRGPVGARLPRAAERQRAVQEGRRPAQRPGADREHLRPPRLRLHRPAPTCAAGSAGGASTPSASPGIDGGKTAILEPRGARRRVLHAAGPHRRRPARPPSSCARSATISTEFARDTADITDRQNIQLHWIRIEDVPEIWQRLEAVGLYDHRGLRRLPRASSSARPSPASPRTRSSTAPRRIDEIKRRYIGDPEFSNLPRKFKTAISGYPLPRRRARGQRHRVRRRRPPRARPRLRPVGRRRPVHQPDARPAARRLGAARRGAPRSGRASSAIFRDYGYRRLRNRGPAEVPGRRLGRGEVPRGAGGRVPRPQADRRPRARAADRRRSTTSACTGRRTAGSTSASRPRSAGSPAPLLDQARRRRRGARLRPGPHHRRTRSCSSSTSPRTGSSRWSPALRGARPRRPGRRTWRRSTMACTGIEFCKLAIVETKAARAPS